MFNELTSRQKIFVLEYLKSKSQKKAAIAAGYAEKSADMQASRLMTKEKIKAAIRQLEARKEADLRVLFLEESRQAFDDILALIGELKEDTHKDVRKQRLLFDALNNVLDRAGYKAPEKLQADIKQENKIFEDMTKEELIEFLRRPTLPEVMPEDEKYSN